MIDEYASLTKNNTEALTGLKEVIKELNDNPNYGVTIKVNTEGSPPRMNYGSRTGTAGQEPKLVIDWTPVQVPRVVYVV